MLASKQTSLSAGKITCLEACQLVYLQTLKTDEEPDRERLGSDCGLSSIEISLYLHIGEVCFRRARHAVRLETI